MKVIFTELYEYGSDFIWSTEVKNGSKIDSLGILSEMCLLLSLLENLACLWPTESVVKSVASQTEEN